MQENIKNHKHIYINDMKINEFIQKYRTVTKLVPGMTSSHTPYVVCNDGFKMSVQAGQSLYSEPRDVADHYEEAEVGYPSKEEYLFAKYAEDEENLCDTVYGYVPCSIIDEVIEKHGGIDESKIKLSWAKDSKARIKGTNFGLSASKSST